MNSYIYLFGLLTVGFIVYFFLRDKLFDTSVDIIPQQAEAFEVPAPASIEVRQAPIYPPRTITSHE